MVSVLSCVASGQRKDLAVKRMGAVLRKCLGGQVQQNALFCDGKGRVSQHLLWRPLSCWVTLHTYLVVWKTHLWAPVPAWGGGCVQACSPLNLVIRKPEGSLCPIAQHMGPRWAHLAGPAAR